MPCLVHANAADDAAAVDLHEAAEARLHGGAAPGGFRADDRRAVGNAEVLAVGAVAAGLAAVLRALGAAVDAAQVVVHAELRPLAARGAARVLLGLLPFRVHRRAVLCQEKRKD